MLLCQQGKERSYMTGSVQVKNGKWYCVLNMKDENGKRKLKWIGTGLPKRVIRRGQRVFYEKR